MGWRRKHVLTLIAVPDGVEVHIVLVVGEEEEAEPWVEGVDWNDEEDPYDVALLPRWAVETEVHVDLGQTEEIKYQKLVFCNRLFIEFKTSALCQDKVKCMAVDMWVCIKGLRCLWRKISQVRLV